MWDFWRVGQFSEDSTYQRVGDIIRISVQLIEPNHQATRWAERYGLTTKDLLNFEDEVAQKLVEGLRVEVSGLERDVLASMPTTSYEAYSLRPIIHVSPLSTEKRSSHRRARQGVFFLDRRFAWSAKIAACPILEIHRRANCMPLYC